MALWSRIKVAGRPATRESSLTARTPYVRAGPSGTCAAPAGPGRPSASAVAAQAFRLQSSTHLADLSGARVAIRELVDGDIKLALVHNYIIHDDLLEHFPALRRARRLCVVADARGASRLRLERALPRDVELHYPETGHYGTHHTKMFVLVYEGDGGLDFSSMRVGELKAYLQARRVDMSGVLERVEVEALCEATRLANPGQRAGVRVIVHTANLIARDLNEMEQGVWFQDFPPKREGSRGAASPFEDALVEYMEATKWPGSVVGGERFTAESLRCFDFSAAGASFVASVPGYHKGGDMRRWGHLAVREVLRREGAGGSADAPNYAIVANYSSLGSVKAEKATGDSRWLSQEMACSLCAGGAPAADIRLVWPTQDEVRTSWGGWATGCSVPGKYANVMLEHLMHRYYRVGTGEPGARIHTPHIKTFARMDVATGRMAYCLLTSSNMSKAAWGQLQKKETQLFIPSFEAGVLLTPASLLRRARAPPFACTRAAERFATALEPPAAGGEPTSVVLLPLQPGGLTCEVPDTAAVARMPLPYALPLRKHDGDVPWCWDVDGNAPDRFGSFYKP